MFRFKAKVGDVSSKQSVLSAEIESTPASTGKDDRTPLGTGDSRVKLLENFVLGGQREFFHKLEKKELEEIQKDESEVQESETANTSASEKTTERKPVWEDEDDQLPIEISRKRRLADILDTIDQKDGEVAPDAYKDRLKKRFDRATKVASTNLTTPNWAELNKREKRRKKRSSTDTESEDDDDTDHITDLSKRTGSYVGTDAYLPKGLLQFKKLRDPTSGYRVKATVTTVEFHKQAQVLLVSGFTQRVQLFKIDGEDNPMLQSVKFDDFPIETAHFSGDGEKVYVGSPLHDYFYYYDMISGKAVKVPQIRSLNKSRMAKFVASPDGNLLAFQGPYGNIYLISAKTYECVSTLKMNGLASALAFSSNGSALYSHGNDGEVYVWDIRNRVCAHRFFDDGCVRGLCIGASSDDRYLATGSNTGVVNIYDVDSIRSSNAPKPLKAIMNLTTATKTVRFNPSSEILALASDVKDKQFRLFHTRSLTTLENFPSIRDRLKHVQCIDFSPNSAYMAVACESGRACLYRLLHFADY